MSVISQSDQIPLPVLLKNVSAEMLLLASAAVEVEKQVGVILSEGVGGLERLSAPIQRLDHLAQLAIELATFMGEVAQSVDSDISVDISHSIHAMGLRALADALIGLPRGAADKRETLGDVDLF